MDEPDAFAMNRLVSTPSVLSKRSVPLGPTCAKDGGAADGVHVPEPGAAVVLYDKVPLLTITDPILVLAPARTRVPGPIFVRFLRETLTGNCVSITLPLIVRLLLATTPICVGTVKLWVGLESITSPAYWLSP